MNVNITYSIILTLVLWLVCNFFRLNMFESILLLLISFLVLQYRFKMFNYFLTIRKKFSKVESCKSYKFCKSCKSCKSCKKRNVRNSYEDLEI